MHIAHEMKCICLKEIDVVFMDIAICLWLLGMVYTEQMFSNHNTLLFETQPTISFEAQT